MCSCVFLISLSCLSVFCWSWLRFCEKIFWILFYYWFDWEREKQWFAAPFIHAFISLLFVCALTRDQTCNLDIPGPHINQLSYPSRAILNSLSRLCCLHLVETYCAPLVLLRFFAFRVCSLQTFDVSTFDGLVALSFHYRVFLVYKGLHLGLLVRSLDACVGQFQLWQLRSRMANTVAFLNSWGCEVNSQASGLWSWLGCDVNTVLIKPGLFSFNPCFVVIASYNISFLFLKDFIYLIFREGGREGERDREKQWCEKEKLVGYLLYAPWWGPNPQCQACTLTEHRTPDLSLCKMTHSWATPLGPHSISNFLSLTLPFCWVVILQLCYTYPDL